MIDIQNETIRNKNDLQIVLVGHLKWKRLIMCGMISTIDSEHFVCFSSYLD
jgi:hypothetical protein